MLGARTGNSAILKLSVDGAPDIFEAKIEANDFSSATCRKAA